MNDIVSSLFDRIDKYKIDNKELRNEIKRLNTAVANARDELARLRRENGAFTEIAFYLACVDESHRTEHDDLLIEEAFRRAREWYKENKE